MRAPPPDRGSGSVLSLALVAVALTMAAGLAVLGQAATASARAGSAADASALAAADVLTGRTTGQPCSQARQAAALSGARLVSCVVDDDGSVRVEVALVPAGAAAHLGAARARARAGASPDG